MKKETTSKCKGLKRKTSDEKRGNPKTQGAQKKEATPKCKATNEGALLQPSFVGSKERSLIKKRGNPKMEGV
jgi:hypothetical protein